MSCNNMLSRNIVLSDAFWSLDGEESRSKMNPSVGEVVVVVSLDFRKVSDAIVSEKDFDSSVAFVCFSLFWFEKELRNFSFAICSDNSFSFVFFSLPGCERISESCMLRVQ